MALRVDTQRLEVFEVAKDEREWARAIEAVVAQGGPESVRPLKVELFRELA